ncbi:MAG: deoxyribose-phosphate aldolase [Casimicrobiaceae bacterium]
MTRAELAVILDHSVLKPESTERDILAGVDVVREWRIGFYCVQLCWVKLACDSLSGTGARIASVVGFPHGCEPAAIKARQAAIAVADGAGEIDMVINVGMLRSGYTTVVATEIADVVRAVGGIPVKVILETGALTHDDKLLGCKLAADAGAAFVKTSTGFHASGGATVADVRLMRAAVGPAVGVKASGGIRTLADAQAMIAAGANRIGTSASAAILEALRP